MVPTADIRLPPPDIEKSTGQSVPLAFSAASEPIVAST